MNDKIITNTITKINFVLLSAALFIFLTLSTLFILLQNGIYLNELSISNIKAKKLYIKWDEKITFTAQELRIDKDNKGKKPDIDYSSLVDVLKTSALLDDWFGSIAIEKLLLNGMGGSFNYTSEDGGKFSIFSDDIFLDSSFIVQEDQLDVKIEKFSHKKKKIFVDGNIRLNNGNDFKINSSLNIDINDDAKLKLSLTADDNRLSYKLESFNDIKNTRYIVDLLNMNPRGKYWVYDAMEMSSFSIKSLSGWLEYDKMDEAYKNLHAEAVANDLVYIYDKKVDSVKTGHTDLEFKNGILYIRPKDAYTYGFFLDRSWLKIDFSKKEELLTLHLLFKGKVNKELLGLLNRYEIKLPFIQTKGEMDTDLKLEINLRTEDVSAIGDFYAKEAQINYLDLDLDLFDTHVYLNNSDVKVNNMFAKYKDMASAYVDLDFNAKKSRGTLKFKFNKILDNEHGIALNKSLKPLHVVYTISPKQDFIEIEKSSWKIKEHDYSIASIKIPFDMDRLSAEIPMTSIEAKDFISAYISGNLSLKPVKADLNIDLLKLNYNGAVLDQPIAKFNLEYDKKFVLSSKNPVKFHMDNKKYTLDNVLLDADSKIVKTGNIRFKIDDNLDSQINALYNIENSSGFVDILNIKYTDAEFGEIFSSNKKGRIHFANQKDRFFVNSKDYGLKYFIDDKEWKLKLNSLEKMAKYSKVLQRYSLTNGSFLLHKVKSKNKMKFTLNSKYRYKLLALNNKPVDDYTVNGIVDSDNDKIHISINDSVYITANENIKIKAQDIGFNLNEILNLLNDENIFKGSNNNSKVSLESKNCYIHFSEDRRAISDEFELQYFNKLLTAQLRHNKGSAYFRLLNDNFELYGEGFNDRFMENLFAVSKFKGGKLEFSVDGTAKEYVGSIYALNTTIRNYRVLNNVLAFVNTIPSLVTFSLPGYNRKGLKADSTYINFSFKDDIYTLSDISLKSKELDILGKGEASIKNNSINLDLNLKTDLGSAVSKIPLVGYILLGDESVSTSLTVTGKLDDPDVNTQVAKDIIVAPLNIIKRTLTLPFELFKDKKKEE